ncbi:DNA translocase FtsK 4TM domain-containing protein [Chloroflexota bacterium]|nr:DNA translocase FtsK 4TM domain-containing protein [Chloroflexota bacterium]
MANKPKTSGKKTTDSKQPGLFKDGDWQSQTVDVFQRFLRYGWDLLGVLLFAFAAILLLGSIGVTQGALISPLSDFLARWLGLGRFLLVAALVVIALQVVRWRKHPPERVPLGKIIGIEFAVFSLMGLLSVIDGATISEAETGQDLGGLVGWGIAEIFRSAVGPTFAFLILFILFGIALIAVLDLVPKLEKAVDARINESALINEEGIQFSRQAPAVVAEPEEEPEEPVEQPKKQVYLPPEFRKSFDTPDMADEAAVNPQERSEALPPLDLLQKGEIYRPDKRSINLTAGLIEKTLAEFGIPAKVVGFRTGPTVTQFAVEPGYIDKTDEDKQKVRVSQISSLQRDLALALSAERLRIEAPVPGKSYVGIEIPNPNAAQVQLRPLIESEEFSRVNSPLALTLGRDVSGRPVVADLSTMPHLLIAGTTGSGKSVCITALTACLVMNNTPEDLKLAMIDPKRVELMRFNGMPHLMGSVETEIERILGVLRWATAEMDYRYKLLEKARARNIDSYNMKMKRQGKKTLPKIVVLIDELADLMISAPDQTEHTLVRLAQKARAIGIHLIVATQRPSTDVVTGLIKANFPTRISFTVASSIDSRVILDTSGAETLLGKGDMLFLHPEVGLPIRAQGVIVTDRDLNRVIRWWQKNEDQGEPPKQDRYDDTEAPPWEEKVGIGDDEDEDEALIDEAIALIRKEGHASASFFQRQLRVGYPRAARLVDQLEEKGILGPSQGGGREREILIELDDDNSEE